MTTSKNTKRALLSSVLAMVLCVAMLVGTTFAWFTDRVVSGNNRIAAGNLDVELYHGANLDETVNEATGLFTQADGTAIKWEPGVIAYENFKVENAGSLALKYQLSMNIIDYNTVNGKSLADVLKVAVLEGEFDGDRAAAQALTFDKTLSDFVKEGSLTAGAEDTYAVVIYWEPSANDNDYNLNNGKTSSDGNPLFIDLGITLVAAQDTVEPDSFDDQYDAGVPLAVYDFTDPSVAAAFCPECYNAGSTADHASHESYMVIEDGVAKIYREGAWISYHSLDWANQCYVMEYDVDASMLANGAFVSFDAGETEAWNDLQLGVKNNSGTYEIYNTLWAPADTSKLLGTIDSNFHVKYTFELIGGIMEMVMTVADGTNTYTVEKTAAGLSDPALCWDVYNKADTAQGAQLVALDNFRFAFVDCIQAASVDELEAAIEDGATVVFSDDINIKDAGYTGDNPFMVDADNVTIDLNGKTLYSANVAFKITGENVTIKNGTVARPEGSDYSYGLKLNGVNTTVENVTIDSGINVSGYGDDGMPVVGISATIRNCNITLDADWAYYAVCAQGEAVVTVEGGEIHRTNPGRANYHFWIEKEFTDEYGHVNSSAMTVRNVTITSDCDTALYNPGGAEPTIIG